MCTDLVLSALAVFRCSEINCTKTTLQELFVSSHLKRCNVFDLEERAVSAIKYNRCAGMVPASVNLPEISSLYLSGTLRALEAVQRSHDDDRCENSDPKEADGEAIGDVPVLNELLEKEVLSGAGGRR